MLRYSEHPKDLILRNLLLFVDHLASKEQIQQIYDLIENADDGWLHFLVSAYNDYVSNNQNKKIINHHVGSFSLITNPEALFRTPEAEKQFIVVLKDYIRDAVGIKREDVANGNNRSDRTNQKNTKDK